MSTEELELRDMFAAVRTCYIESLGKKIHIEVYGGPEVFKSEQEIREYADKVKLDFMTAGIVKEE